MFVSLVILSCLNYLKTVLFVGSSKKNLKQQFSNLSNGGCLTRLSLCTVAFSKHTQRRLKRSQLKLQHNPTGRAVLACVWWGWGWGDFCWGLRKVWVEVCRQGLQILTLFEEKKKKKKKRQEKSLISLLRF